MHLTSLVSWRIRNVEPLGQLGAAVVGCGILKGAEQ